MPPGHLPKECQLIALFSVRSEVSRAVYDGHFPAPRQKFPYGLAKRLCVPPVKEFGAFIYICHRHNGRRQGKRKPTAVPAKETSNALRPFSGPYCCSQKREFSFAIFCTQRYSQPNRKLGETPWPA